jgi:uncharacterized protein
MTDQNNNHGSAALPKLDDKAFEAFLLKRRPFPPICTMTGLEGYLTALIIGPKFIDPFQWIPLFTGEEALNAPMETTEHQAVQTIVAEYNRISSTLAERPKTHRPRFKDMGDKTYDRCDWSSGFLMGTDFAEKQWRPVIRGHAVTGDIIAPIRALSYANKPIPDADVVAVAEAIVQIRSYFMPRRAKAKY